MDKKLYRPLLNCILVIIVGLILTGVYVFTVEASAKSLQSWIWRVDDPPGPQTALVGRQPGDGFGEVLAKGDINGDSYEDLIVGARYTQVISSAEGEVYVLPGPLAFGETISMPLHAALRLLGAWPDDELGTYVDSGDLNGDGYDDIIAGTVSEGRVYVYLGSPEIAVTSPLTVTVTPGNVAMTVLPTNDGFTVCNVNHDGFDDLIVEYRDPQLGGIGYQVIGILGSPELRMSQPITIDLRSDPVELVVTGFNLFMWSWPSPENLDCGDVDGDGYDDLVIGAFGESPDARLTAGTVYVIRGSSEITRSKHVVVQVPEGAGAIFEGLDGNFGLNGDFLGRALTVAEMNGDDREDLILGAPGGDGPENTVYGAGEVYGWMGRALNGQHVDLRTETEWILYGDDQDSFLGSTLGAGDFDGDGLAEALLGCPSCRAQPPEGYFGRGYVIDADCVHGEHRAMDVSTVKVFPPPSIENFALGEAVQAVDTDRDGVQDIIITGMGTQDIYSKIYLIDYPLLTHIFFPIFLR